MQIAEWGVNTIFFEWNEKTRLCPLPIKPPYFWAKPAVKASRQGYFEICSSLWRGDSGKGTFRGGYRGHTGSAKGAYRGSLSHSSLMTPTTRATDLMVG